MVEAPVGLVVGDDEDRLAEHVRVRHQNVDDLRDLPGAIVGQAGVAIQEICGSLPSVTSLRKSSNKCSAQASQSVAGAPAGGIMFIISVPVAALSNSGVPGAAVAY